MWAVAYGPQPGSASSRSATSSCAADPTCLIASTCATRSKRRARGRSPLVAECTAQSTQSRLWSRHRIPPTSETRSPPITALGAVSPTPTITNGCGTAQRSQAPPRPPTRSRAVIQTSGPPSAPPCRPGGRHDLHWHDSDALGDIHRPRRPDRLHQLHRRACLERPSRYERQLALGQLWHDHELDGPREYPRPRRPVRLVGPSCRRERGARTLAAP